MMARGLKITLFGVLGIPLLALVLFFTGWLWPMHTAVGNGIKPLVWVLAKAGMAESKMPGFKGGCILPLKIAVEKGDSDIVDILLDAGADISFRECPSFYYGVGQDVLTASVGNPQLLEHLLAVRHIDPNIRDERGSLPAFSLLWCHGGTKMVKGKTVTEANAQRLRSLKLFLDHGADINSKGKDGGTLLSGAALHGCTETVRALLGWKADAAAAERGLQEYFSRRDERKPISFDADRIEAVKDSISLIKRAAGK